MTAAQCPVEPRKGSLSPAGWHLLCAAFIQLLSPAHYQVGKAQDACPHTDSFFFLVEEKVTRYSYSGRRVHREPPCVTQGAEDCPEGIAPSKDPLAQDCPAGAAVPSRALAHGTTHQLHDRHSGLRLYEAYRMRRRISSSPDWNGMWKNWHILGSSAHALTKRSVKYLAPHSWSIRSSTKFCSRTLLLSNWRDQGSHIAVPEPTVLLPTSFEEGSAREGCRMGEVMLIARMCPCLPGKAGSC